MNTYKNIGLLFNKHYFKGLDFKKYPDTTDDEKKLKATVKKENEEKLKDRNQILFDSSMDENIAPVEDLDLQSFKLKTIYPGLFSGSGYAHESAIEGELKLGFFFDYTSGLPCLPGSSVKGVLRNACTMDKGGYAKWIIEELASGERESEVQSEAKNVNTGVFLFKDTGKLNKKGDPIFKESEFIKTVFDAPENISIYQRDIFFDAFPVSAKTKLLGSDYITPHKDSLKNPIPLQFMKVMPEVEFEFRFKIVKSNGVSEAFKKELFRQILLDLGIGAKTNVGYGQFEQKINRSSPSASVETPSGAHSEAGEIDKQIPPKVELKLKPDEVMAEYLKPDLQNRNNVVVKIISVGDYKDQEVSFRYPAGMTEKQQLIIKLSLTKKKVIQSATVVRILK